MNDIDMEANRLLQRDGFLVLATDEKPVVGKVTQHYGGFVHPVVIIGTATIEEYEHQHGRCIPNPYSTERYFIKVAAE
jgi:hypothetical protein